MRDMDLSNRTAYEDPGVVKGYVSEKELQPAERTIWGILKDQLPLMKMLDIGVGAGRTALQFGPRVKEYTGVDYSERMIKACRDNLGQNAPNMSFMVCDARSMGMFKDNTFDFVLFSFNGIDYMSHEDRAKALREIRRVAKPGGYFCFSTHNILCIEKYLKISLCFNPMRLLKIVQRYGEIKNLIRSHKGVQHIPYSVVRDGAEEFLLTTYYINPNEQIRELKNMEFKNVRVFSEKTGDEIIDHSLLARMKQERWFYFLCAVDK